MHDPHMSEDAIGIVDVPGPGENLAAHVGGCVTTALDPLRQYLGVV
jgi:hypothetical protein